LLNINNNNNNDDDDDDDNNNNNNNNTCNNNNKNNNNHSINDLVARCFASAGLNPVTKEPTGLFRTVGKRPD